MSTVNDELHIDREEGRKLYEEADKLLSLAERLQEKCEQYQRNQWISWAVSFMIAVFGAVGVNLIALTIGWSYRTLLVTTSWIIVLIAGFWPAYVFVRTRPLLTRERRAIHSIVDMLRGLEKGIAEKNNLSTLERAELRIRLSRFDIGPG